MLSDLIIIGFFVIGAIAMGFLVFNALRAKEYYENFDN